MKSLKHLLARHLPPGTLAHLSAVDHYFNGEPEIRLIRRLCRPDGVALDIGANIGTYTYFLRRHAREVYAYEPNPALAERLRRLYPNVHVVNAAASDREGKLELRIPVRAGRRQHEQATVIDAFGSDEVVSCHVDAVTVDSARLENVGFIKIDVEMHELNVLRGALDTIRAWRPVIMTECTPLRYEKDLPETFAFITELGYEGWFTFEGRHLPFSAYRADLHANRERFGISFMNPNIFFFPREIPGRELLGKGARIRREAGEEQG